MGFSSLSSEVPFVNTSNSYGYISLNRLKNIRGAPPDVRGLNHHITMGVHSSIIVPSIDPSLVNSVCLFSSRRSLPPYIVCISYDSISSSPAQPGDGGCDPSTRHSVGTYCVTSYMYPQGPHSVVHLRMAYLQN